MSGGKVRHSANSDTLRCKNTALSAITFSDCCYATRFRSDLVERLSPSHTSSLNRLKNELDRCTLGVRCSQQVEPLIMCPICCLFVCSIRGNINTYIPSGSTSPVCSASAPRTCIYLYDTYLDWRSALNVYLQLCEKPLCGCLAFVRPSMAACCGVMLRIRMITSHHFLSQAITVPIGWTDVE